jgi:ribonuclease P protein component
VQRRERLTDGADFERLRAEGRQHRHPFYTLSVAANGLAHNRYGFITSRRLGGAVVRNRVRRRLREAVRRAAPRLKSGFDVVIIAREAIVGQPYEQITAALDDLLRRARLEAAARPEGTDSESRRSGHDPAV